MKHLIKLGPILLTLSLFLGISPVHAGDNRLDSGYIVYGDHYTPADAVLEAENGYLSNGDLRITKDAILEAMEIANINSSSTNHIKPMSTGEEQWILQSQTTVVGYTALKGKYLKKVAAGVSTSQSTGVSLTLSGKIKGIPISGAFTYNNSVTYNGPGIGTRVGNASTGNLTYMSATTNNTKTISEASYISGINSDYAWEYISF